MGCFSFLCKKCGKGIQSTSFSGHKCHLFLLNKGDVIQKMSGEYDSYGRVFIDDTQNPEVKHDLRISEKWKDPFPEKPPTKHDQYFIDKGDDGWIWHRVCDLISYGNKESLSGIAAYHVKCYDGEIPTTASLSDPNQGWGEDGEDFTDTSADKYKD